MSLYLQGRQAPAGGTGGSGKRDPPISLPWITRAESLTAAVLPALMFAAPTCPFFFSCGFTFHHFQSPEAFFIHSFCGSNYIFPLLLL